MDNVKTVVTENQKDLENLNNQRYTWLRASSVVFISIISVIFGWDWISGLHSKTIWWFIVICMLVISINWWYWTMRIIRRLVTHQVTEYNLLISIIADISQIKKDVKELRTKTIDKSK